MIILSTIAKVEIIIITSGGWRPRARELSASAAGSARAPGWKCLMENK
jgi:hypothetical protein